MSAGADVFAGWQVESLRLTLFHPDHQPEQGLWQESRKTPPESIETKPRERQLVEHGTVADNILMLVSGTGRLDWHLRPSNLPTNESREGLLVLAHTDQVLSTFSEALRASIRRHRQVYRLALGTVLNQPVGNLGEGFAILSKYLPNLKLETHGDHDFMYRINRRRSSSSSRHVIINRLASWSVETVTTGSIQLTAHEQPRVLTTPYLCVRLVMDINTAPGPSAISAGGMPSLFAECTEFAHEIAAKGDIP